MLSKIGEKFTDIFKKNMPDAFVFAIVLTFLTSFLSFSILGTSFFKIVDSWYKGFWNLLEFGMQMVLLIVTGYSIAISPFVNRLINNLSNVIKTPNQVYYFVTLFGILASLISWGWIVIAAVLGRELSMRVKGVNYPYLISCTYLSNTAWVLGLSSTIPLLLNTENNYLINDNILSETIPTSFTLGSIVNIVSIGFYLIFTPLIMLMLKPKKALGAEHKDLLYKSEKEKKISIKDEAKLLKNRFWNLSDSLNNSVILIYLIAFMGISYIVRYFYFNGFDINLNIMIFIFLILGMFLHKSPIRYGISIKRTSSNVSAILFQFPFYAGIMGIMMYTGLGVKLAELISTYSSLESYPFFSYLLGAIVNFAIPSGGGEFAVIGPSVIEAVKVLGQGFSEYQITEMISRASLSVAYGETLTNLLNPFYLLLIIPIMGAGIKIQARDVMGYLVIPFIIHFFIISLFITYLPINL